MGFLTDVGLAIDYDVAIALAVWAFLVASLVVEEQAEGVGLWGVVHGFVD